MKVTETVEEAMKEGQVIIAVNLDIENAFNSIPWGKNKVHDEKEKVPIILEEKSI